MVDFFHVYEVDNNDTAEVSQPELPRDGNGGLEICPVNCLLEIPMTDVTTRIYVDRRHRFCLIENQVTTRFKSEYFFPAICGSRPRYRAGRKIGRRRLVQARVPGADMQAG